MTTCECCHDGKFQPHYGKNSPDSCEGCPAGKYDHDSSPLTACAGCVPGRYREDGAAQVCTACELGTYQPSYNASFGTNCTECPKGTFDDDSAAGRGDSAVTQCSACPTGQYQDEMLEIFMRQNEFEIDDGGFMDDQREIEGDDDDFFDGAVD